MASFPSTGLSSLSAVSLFATILLPLLSVLPLASAQQTILDFSSGALPACAEQCSPLLQAQTACAFSDAGTQPCFCRSAYLATLYQTPNGVCDAVCTQQADLTQIQQWFLGICSEAALAAAATAQAPAAEPATATVTEPVATVTVTPTSAATSRAPRPASATGRSSDSWWSNHWQWILMLILIIIGLVLLALALLFFKRRHNRKQEEMAREKAGADSVVWGPLQSTHSTAGFSYPDTSSVRGNRWSGTSGAESMDIMAANQEPVPAMPPLPGDMGKGRVSIRQAGPSSVDIMRGGMEKDLEKGGALRGGAKTLSKNVGQ